MGAIRYLQGISNWRPHWATLRASSQPLSQQTLARAGSVHICIPPATIPTSAPMGRTQTAQSTLPSVPFDRPNGQPFLSPASRHLHAPCLRPCIRAIVRNLCRYTIGPRRTFNALTVYHTLTGARSPSISQISPNAISTSDQRNCSIGLSLLLAICVATTLPSPPHPLVTVQIRESSTASPSRLLLWLYLSTNLYISHPITTTPLLAPRTV